MNKYRLYIDESGTSSYKNMTENNKYLTLSGIIIKQEDNIEISYNMNKLKLKYFNYDVDHKPIILHREDIYNCRKGFECLSNEETKESFNKDLILFLKKATYVIIGVTINKESRFKRYKYPQDPYTTALETLIKRYVIFLEDHNAKGDVLLESRNPKDNKTLESIFKQIYNYGTKNTATHVDMTYDRFQKALTSNSLKFKNKTENIAGLQIADMLANPLKSKLILLEENQNLFSTFSTELYSKIEHKIRANKFGQQIGYGLVYCK